MVGFLRVIAVPIGNFDQHIFCTIGNALAAQARLGCNARSFVELIELGIGGLVAGFQSFVHDHVTGGAGANAAAGMVEAKVRSVPGVMDARVQVVFDPPWEPSRMSEAARLQLGMF